LLAKAAAAAAVVLQAALGGILSLAAELQAGLQTAMVLPVQQGEEGLVAPVAHPIEQAALVAPV
jgi:hypothetical protein